MTFQAKWEKAQAKIAMDAKLKAEWVKALRSEEYQQHRGGLCADSQKPNTLCCLGVLWAISGRPRDLGKLWDQHVPNSKAALISMNDDERKSFPEIADFIEANL